MKKFPSKWFEQKKDKLFYGVSVLFEGSYFLLIVLVAFIYTISIDIISYTKRRLK